MLDVLLVTGCVPPVPCGVGHYTVGLRDALRAEGVRCDVAVVARWGDLRRLRRRVHDDGPRVVHLMYPTRGYDRSLLPMLIPFHGRPARILVGIHEYTKTHRLRRLAALALAAQAWRVVVSSEVERAALRRFRPSVVPIPATVVTDPGAIPAPPPARSQPDPVEVVFFGFLHPRKGVETLIEACALLTARGRRTSLRLMGQTPPELAGYRGSLEQLARARGVAAEFAGEVPDGRVVAELQRADLCVLPFREGASPRHTTLITALQAGVPVVTTTGLDVPPGLRHGEHAWLVPPADPAALAAAIATLADNPAARSALSKGGRAFGAAFTWSAVAQAFLDVYGL